MTAPGVLYLVSKNEDQAIHKPVSRMLQLGQVQNSVLQGSIELYALYSSHFRSFHRSFTAWWLLQKSGDPTDKNLLLCTLAQPTLSFLLTGIMQKLH